MNETVLYIQVLGKLYNVLTLIRDSWVLNQELLSKFKLENQGEMKTLRLTQLVDRVLAELDYMIMTAREMFSVMGEDGNKSGGSLRYSNFGDFLDEPYSDTKTSRCQSPGTPTSVLPEFNQSFATPTSVLPELNQSFADCSYSPPLLGRLRLQAVGKLKPINVKCLSFHMFPHIESRSSSPENGRMTVGEMQPEKKRAGSNSSDQKVESKDSVVIEVSQQVQKGLENSGSSSIPPPPMPAATELKLVKEPSPFPESYHISHTIHAEAVPSQVIRREPALSPESCQVSLKMQPDVSIEISPEPPPLPRNLSAEPTLSMMQSTSQLLQPNASGSELASLSPPKSTLCETVTGLPPPPSPRPPPMWLRNAMTSLLPKTTSATPLPPPTPPIIEKYALTESPSILPEISPPDPPKQQTLFANINVPQAPPMPQLVLPMDESMSVPVAPPMTSLSVSKVPTSPSPPPPRSESQTKASTMTPPPVKQTDEFTPIPPPPPPPMPSSKGSAPPPPPPPILQPNGSAAPPPPPPMLSSNGSVPSVPLDNGSMSVPVAPPMTSLSASKVPTPPSAPPPLSESQTKASTMTPPLVKQTDEFTPTPPRPMLPSKGSAPPPPPPPPPILRPNGSAAPLPPPPMLSSNGSVPSVPLDNGSMSVPVAPPTTSLSASKVPTPPSAPPPLSKSQTKASTMTPPPVKQTDEFTQTPPPPPPPPMLPSKGSAPPPPPPPILRPNGSAAPPPPPPMLPSNGSVPSPPPPIPLSSGTGVIPPPPGAARSLRPKKANTKLKRSPHMANLYRVLKRKVEGTNQEGKVSSGKKNIDASSGGSKQSMADALAEMTKRSSYFQQIEEDVQKHSKTIMDMKNAIKSFQATNLDELNKFCQHVESHLDKLTDETQVLARFEDFPTKKLETLRTAAALYAKLNTMRITLTTWKLDPPVGALLDKVESYFNKIKGEVDALDRTKDEESKRFQSHKITFDFHILVQIKESMVDLSSSCMELALKESIEAKAACNGETGSKSEKRLKVCTKMLWRAFQLAFHVYTFAGGHDDRADMLTRELAHEIENDPQN